MEEGSMSYLTAKQMQENIFEINKEMERLDDLKVLKRKSVQKFRDVKIAEQRVKELELREEIAMLKPQLEETRHRMVIHCRDAARHRMERLAGGDRQEKLKGISRRLQTYSAKLQKAIAHIKPDRDYLDTCCARVGFRKINVFLHHHESLVHLKKEQIKKYNTDLFELEEQKKILVETKKSYAELKVYYNNIMSSMVQRLDTLERTNKKMEDVVDTWKSVSSLADLLTYNKWHMVVAAYGKLTGYKVDLQEETNPIKQLDIIDLIMDRLLLIAIDFGLILHKADKFNGSVKNPKNNRKSVHPKKAVKKAVFSSLPKPKTGNNKKDLSTVDEEDEEEMENSLEDVNQNELKRTTGKSVLKQKSVSFEEHVYRNNLPGQIDIDEKAIGTDSETKLSCSLLHKLLSEDTNEINIVEETNKGQSDDLNDNAQPPIKTIGSSTYKLSTDKTTFRNLKSNVKFPAIQTSNRNNQNKNTETPFWRTSLRAKQRCSESYTQDEDKMTRTNILHSHTYRRNNIIRLPKIKTARINKTIL